MLDDCGKSDIQSWETQEETVIFLKQDEGLSFTRGATSCAARAILGVARICPRVSRQGSVESLKLGLGSFLCLDSESRPIGSYFHSASFIVAKVPHLGLPHSGP